MSLIPTSAGTTPPSPPPRPALIRLSSDNFPSFFFVVVVGDVLCRCCFCLRCFVTSIRARRLNYDSRLLLSLYVSARTKECSSVGNDAMLTSFSVRNMLCAWRHNMPPPLSSPRGRPRASRAAEQTQRSTTFPRRIRSHADRCSRLTR